MAPHPPPSGVSPGGAGALSDGTRAFCLERIEMLESLGNRPNPDGARAGLETLLDARRERQKDKPSSSALPGEPVDL